MPCAPTGLRLAGINDHSRQPARDARSRAGARRTSSTSSISTPISSTSRPFATSPHKCVTTLHGRQDFPDFWPAYRAFPEMKLVSISDDQRRPIADANFVGTVHHGLPPGLIPFGRRRGRLSRLHRPHLAGEAARPGDRDRPARRDEAQDRRQGRSRRRGLFRGADRAAARRPRCRVHRRDRRRARSPPSSAARAPCSSRSTGRSRSGW